MRFRDAILNDIYGEKISENIAVDNNGQLICSNCILARTGYYDYRESELIDGGSEEKIVKVYRSPEEVFDKESIKSMNFKPLVNDHPQDNVTPESVSYLQKGFIINTRRGEGEFSECLMADIVVTDPYVIDLIKSGDKRELSVGYTSDIEEKDGKYFMKNIRGNHVALCDAGRAGIAKIRDSKTVNDSSKKENVIKLAKKYGGKLVSEMPDGELVFTKLGQERGDNFAEELEKLGIKYSYNYGGDDQINVFVNDSSISVCADALSFKVGEYALSTNGFSGIITEVHPNFIFVKDKNGDEHLVEKRFVAKVSKTKIQDEDFDDSNFDAVVKDMIISKNNIKELLSDYSYGENATDDGSIELVVSKGTFDPIKRILESGGYHPEVIVNGERNFTIRLSDSEPSPSTIKLSNGSIVNFYGWAERNGYGATYYSVGTKTRGGFIFKAHFENEQLAKNYSVSSEESTVVVRSRIGITKSEVIDSLKKFTVKVNGKSYATNARTHADAVKKVSKALNDTIQYPEAKQLIAKARDLGFLFEGQVNGEWVFNFGKAPIEALEELAEAGKKINPNYKQVVHGNKIFIGDNSIKDAKTLWLVNVGQDRPIKKVYASSESKAREFFESKGLKVNAVSKSLNTPMNSNFIETADDLVESPTEEALKKNIATEVKAGKPVNQAVAIAKSVQSESKDEKDPNPNAGPDWEYLPDSIDKVNNDAVEDGTYEFITLKNGETDSTFIKARSQEEAMAIFRNNNKAGKLLEYGVFKGGRYRALSDSQKIDGYTEKELLNKIGELESKSSLSYEERLKLNGLKDKLTLFDTQSTEKMAQTKYDELKRSLKELENEIDRNDDNPNYNLVSKSRELEKLQDEISKLKKDFGYALKDSRG